MIKNFIKLVLQKLFGFENYLYIFSLFIIKKLPWDRNEKDFMHFLRMIPDNGVILDIGANIGVMSYYLSKNKPHSHIYSFEPIANNYNNMERVIKRYNLTNISIEKFALGQEEGEIEMVMPVINSVKFHGLSHVVHNTIKDYNEGNRFKVPIKKLDIFDIDRSHKSAIKAIKIDVENFEYFVLKGGEKLIERDKPVIYAELWEGENRNNTFNLLKGLGYKINIVENKKLVNFTGQQKQNFIFVP